MSIFLLRSPEKREKITPVIEDTRTVIWELYPKPTLTGEKKLINAAADREDAHAERSVTVPSEKRPHTSVTFAPVPATLALVTRAQKKKTNDASSSGRADN